MSQTPKKNPSVATAKSTEKAKRQSSLLSFFSPSSKPATQSPTTNTPSKKIQSTSKPSIASDETPLTPTKPNRVNQQENVASSLQKRKPVKQAVSTQKPDLPSSDGSESLPTPSSQMSSPPPITTWDADDKTLNSQGFSSSPEKSGTSGFIKRVSKLTKGSLLRSANNQ